MAVIKNNPMNILKNFLTLSLLACATIAQAGLPIQHWQSTSGAQVYFVENHDLPIVDVSINFAAGSSHDLRDKAGTAAMTQRLLSLGAGGMTDDQIAVEFADAFCHCE